jgi:hypothetical protein
MTDAHAIPMLEAMRDLGRLGSKIGVRVGPLARCPAETLGMILALLALPPPITWDGELLEGALLLELGERAAHALRLARRRVRRRALRAARGVAVTVSR